MKLYHLQKFINEISVDTSYVLAIRVNPIEDIYNIEREVFEE